MNRALDISIQVRLREFVPALEEMGSDARKSAIMCEILENSGDMHFGANVFDDSPYRCMVHLHEIIAYGKDEATAIDAWIASAKVQLLNPAATSALPFPNPRNHSEEIANLLA